MSSVPDTLVSSVATLFGKSSCILNFEKTVLSDMELNSFLKGVVSYDDDTSRTCRSRNEVMTFSQSHALSY